MQEEDLVHLTSIDRSIDRDMETKYEDGQFLGDMIESWMGMKDRVEDGIQCHSYLVTSWLSASSSACWKSLQDGDSMQCCAESESVCKRSCKHHLDNVDMTMDLVESHAGWGDLLIRNGKRLRTVSPSWCPFISAHWKTTIPQSVSGASPWLMTTTATGMAYQFFSCLVPEKFEMANPVASCGICLYSKGGWLLIAGAHPKVRTRIGLSLRNACSNQIIQLPSCGRPKQGVFTISVTDETASPDCVVTVSGLELGLEVAMWRPGWLKWKKYEFDHLISPSKLVFCGGKIRLFHKASDRMFTIELSGDSMTMLHSRKLNRPDCYGGILFIMPSQDGREILNVCCSCKEGKLEYKFYKLDPLELGWIKLEKEEWMGSSWFLNPGFSFSANVSGGGKVYSKSKNMRNKVLNIVVDDLVEGQRHCITSAITSYGRSAWIDLGM
ncbi:hypothetical protein RJ640_010819 [Escallonia rubra]|uniref:KIB1-4 beta-propeller domain-containing protein n=1 Tax=Escallonia rubra TaxID=112253 RepID=A0AA88QQC7_9ASTE|nr:hypothetical protein RJ640_010819 [Escallonia rubra]